MRNPIGPLRGLNPFRSTRSYATGINPSVGAGKYFYEEAGLTTTFDTPEALVAYTQERDAEERTPKLLTALAVALILAGLWFAYKKK